MVTDLSDAISCFDVEISGTRIRQLDGDKVMATIQKDQIRTIKLAHETNAKYPFFRFFLGFSVLALGLMGLLISLLANRAGGSIRTESGALVIPMIPMALWLLVGIGVWLLVGIFGVRYLFLIDTETGTHKIYFKKSTSISEIKQFIRKAEFSFGYEIDVSILQQAEPE